MLQIMSIILADFIPHVYKDFIAPSHAQLTRSHTPIFLQHTGASEGTIYLRVGRDVVRSKSSKEMYIFLHTVIIIRITSEKKYISKN